ncbi:hypothetical protein [Mycobacterium marinum]|uniref:hypothetical protein n=1 Tax=Mycobacterium marinum TaxID=1781 RepID=UPI000B970913|nr:hypothetical protein [Mycobacterium marinum]
MAEATLKLSEASKQCGIPARTLKLLIADGLFPQAIRTPQGHPLFPADQVPTWQECRDLIEQRRDAALARASRLLDRLQVEMEAIRNDIAEAREHPTQPLGVDFSSASSYTPGPNQTTLSAVLLQFDLARMDVHHYHAALVDVVETDRS